MGKVSKALNKAGSLKPNHTSTPPIKRVHNAKSTIFAPPSPPSERSIENWDERLISAMENSSGVPESIRKMRTLILHPEDENPAKSIMVLSSDAQEGKSFVCANLGISFAHGVDKHALMVDCDLRRPSLQTLFGLKQEKGLANYLGDEDNLSNLITDTGLAKLSIIPSGQPPVNPSELLSSEKMYDMIEELTNRYNNRLILLDSPPFHAASETLVLSQLVDKVVLVVRWGKSGRENVKKLIDKIGREKIIGVVFNAFEMNILDRKVQGVGYHDYYSESY